MYDFHIHTTFSPDGQSSVEEYCRRAELIGCDGICGIGAAGDRAAAGRHEA